MDSLKVIVTIVFQVFVGYALAFGIVFLTGATNGWEIAASAIGGVVGVWAVGAIGKPALSSESIRLGKGLLLLLGTFLGALAGTLIVVTLGKGGLVFAWVFFVPLLGALAGYYGFPGLMGLFSR